MPRQVVVFVVGGLTLPEIRAAHEAPRVQHQGIYRLHMEVSMVGKYSGNIMGIQWDNGSITNILGIFFGNLWNGGFWKWGYPKMDGLQGKIPLKWMIYGHPYFRKPPYHPVRVVDGGWQPFDSDFHPWLGMVYLCYKNCVFGELVHSGPWWIIEDDTVHKPSMTGNGKHTICKHREIGDGLWLFYQHYGEERVQLTGDLLSILSDSVDTRPSLRRLNAF